MNWFDRFNRVVAFYVGIFAAILIMASAVLTMKTPNVALTEKCFRVLSVPSWLWLASCLYLAVLFLARPRLRENLLGRMMGVSTDEPCSAGARAIQKTFFGLMGILIVVGFLGMIETNLFSVVRIDGEPIPVRPTSSIPLFSRVAHEKDYRSVQWPGIRLPILPARATSEEIVVQDREYLWIRGTVLSAEATRLILSCVALQFLFVAFLTKRYLKNGDGSLQS